MECGREERGVRCSGVEYGREGVLRSSGVREHERLDGHGDGQN